jgi:hypothetical protein
VDPFVDRSGRRRTRWPLLIVGLLASIASCSTDDARTASASLVPTTAGETTRGAAVTSTNPPNGIDPGLQPYIDLAVADLAARLQREPSAIVTRSAVLIVWPDASLGCPKPGMQYAQVQTDGSQIVLEVDGVAYDYHAGGSTTPFLCEPTTKTGSSTTGG